MQQHNTVCSMLTNGRKRTRPDDESALDLASSSSSKRNQQFSIDHLLSHHRRVEPTECCSTAPIVDDQVQSLVADDDDDDNENRTDDDDEEDDETMALVYPQGNASSMADVECRLEGADGWMEFHQLGTEMIITKSGRYGMKELIC